MRIKTNKLLMIIALLTLTNIAYSADRLARIGGFTGGGGAVIFSDEESAIARKQRETKERIAAMAAVELQRQAMMKRKELERKQEAQAAAEKQQLADQKKRLADEDLERRWQIAKQHLIEWKATKQATDAPQAGKSKAQDSN